MGLFPTVDATGGVQASGRVAWEVVAAEPSDGSRAESRASYLFCHCGAVPTGCGHGAERTIHAASKPSAILAALSRRWPVDTALVWHVGLLKLLPFFRLSNAHVALFLHGIEAWRRQDWFARVLLRKVDLFLTNSDYTWRRFVELNPEYASGRHETLQLGIDVPVGGDIPVPDDPPAALILGRLARDEDYKGQRELIQAWPLVLEQIPKAELWIAGDGDLRPELERLVGARGLASNVRFFGWVSEEHKQELISRSRCLAMPSRAEGFGLVYLEAMRLGRPCLVSTLDAGREVVNPPEAGLAVDPSCREELAAAVCRLLTPSLEWQAWSRQAQERYEGGFTARHFQERLVAALAPLSSQGSSPLVAAAAN